MEDYEKKYKEVLERARKAKEHAELTDKETYIIDSIFPELKESEDERIRKELIGHCKDLVRMNKDDKVLLSIYEPWLAWLEKQKENPKSADSIPSNCVSDVKWADTIITRAIVALSDDVDYNRDEPCKYRREIDDLKKLRDVLCGQKEQKGVTYDLTDLQVLGPGLAPAPWPVCYKDPDEEMIESINTVFDAAAKNNIVSEDHTLYKMRAWLRSLRNRSCDDCKLRKKAWKPAEWSEEDEKKLSAVISLMKSSRAVDPFYDKMCLEGWLKALPERFNLQSKQEWSEEDEDMIQDIIDELDSMDARVVLSKNGEEYYPEDHGKQVAWLKSLRPSWKPSEEQMEALGEEVRHAKLKHNASIGEYPRYGILQSLYDQLEQLLWKK